MVDWPGLTSGCTGMLWKKIDRPMKTAVIRFGHLALHFAQAIPEFNPPLAANVPQILVPITLIPKEGGDLLIRS